MKKDKYKVIKIQILTAQAKPATLGSILGQHGINIIKFCKDFNTQTKNMDVIKITVVIHVFFDKSFSFF